MIREEKFLISRRAYAVDLSTLRGEMASSSPSTHYYRGTIDAVWFRRKDGITAACVGTLWDYQDAEPADAVAFLKAHEDGRYGGRCEGRWDGTRYWGSQDPEEIERHLALLRPMLASYPAIPPGFSGWYRFGQVAP